MEKKASHDDQHTNEAQQMRPLPPTRPDHMDQHQHPPINVGVLHVARTSSS